MYYVTAIPHVICYSIVVSMEGHSYTDSGKSYKET